MKIVPYAKKYIKGCIDIWNGIVIDGNAFPQEDILDEAAGDKFFASQTFTGVALDEDETVLGLYILHPNNIGRCGHISNASYAVKKDRRGEGIGESLVTHCMATAKEKGFKILQFNAVVATNAPALALYKKLGFVRLGTIKNGFLLKNGDYADIIPHYILL